MNRRSCVIRVLPAPARILPVRLGPGWREGARAGWDGGRGAEPLTDGRARVLGGARVRCRGVPPAAGRRKGRRPGQRLKDGSISQANAQAAPQQQAQQQASANAQAEQTAQGDLSALQGAADFSSELGSMSSDLSTIQNDLQTEKNDAAQGPGSDCYGISRVG